MAVTMPPTLAVGAKVGKISYTVSASDVAEYLDVMNFPPDADIPPDFLPRQCMHELFDSAFDAIGPNIRAKQAFDFFAPVRIGMEVSGLGFVVDRYEKRGKWFFTLEGIYTDSTETLLVRDRRTQLQLPEQFDIDLDKGGKS